MTNSQILFLLGGVLGVSNASLQVYSSCFVTVHGKWKTNNIFILIEIDHDVTGHTFISCGTFQSRVVMQIQREIEVSHTCSIHGLPC